MSDIQSIKPDAVFVRKSDVLDTEIDNDLVLLDIVNSKYYGMQEVGLRIWQLLEVPSSMDAICAALLEEYDVDEATCRQDVMDFMQKLSEAELITLQA